MTKRAGGEAAAAFLLTASPFLLPLRWNAVCEEQTAAAPPQARSAHGRTRLQRESPWQRQGVDNCKEKYAKVAVTLSNVGDH